LRDKRKRVDRGRKKSAFYVESRCYKKKKIGIIWPRLIAGPGG